MPKFNPADPVAYVLALANTDPEKAEDLLREFFCAPVEGGGIPDQRVLEYLAMCFRAVVAGMDADLALGVRRPKNKKRRVRDWDDEYALARSVHALMLGGLIRDEAIERVAEDKGVPEGRVKKAYEAWGFAAKKLAGDS